MRRLLAIGVCALAGAFISAMPAAAANRPNDGKGTNWGQKDTAVYVVSTLNLLHDRRGHAVTSVLNKRYNVTLYEVYADTSANGLYFIQLKTAVGSVFGALAYQMGWSKPLSVSVSLDALHIRHATSDIQRDFAGDPKQLIGSFASTLPS